MHFEIFKEKDNGILGMVKNPDKRPQWYWHLIANNGKKIADSGEGYNNREDCEHGITLVKGALNNTPVKDAES